jgi:hypothetical protein
MSDLDKQPTIVLAGGRIRCRRCQAVRRRSQEQCKKAALKNKRVCAFHGGRSTGPTTESGKQRMAASKTVHGFETRQLRIDRSLQLAELRTLEEAGRALGIIGGAPSLGRKPNAALSIKTPEQAIRWLRTQLGEEER